MAKPPTKSDLPDNSPYHLLAVLCSARRSKDRELERVTRSRLAGLGVRVAFGNELPPPSRKKGVARD